MSLEQDLEVVGSLFVDTAPIFIISRDIPPTGR